MKEKLDSENKRFFQRKGTKVGILLMMFFILLIGFFDFGSVEVEANVQDFSMYSRASEIATAFGTDMAPSTDEDSPEASPWLSGNTNAGNAGGLLGYSRDLSDDEEGIIGWITSRYSANSMTYNYGQLASLGGGSYDLSENHLLAYGLYGAQLQALGLVDASDHGFGDKIVGFLFSGIYWVSQIVPFIFNIILKLLVLLNPFQLFFGAMGLVDQLGVPFLSDLAETIGSIYQAIQNISIVVTVPMLIGLTAVSIFMFRGNAGKKLLRVVVRVFMIFAGLPLIAMTYTSVIEDLSDSMEMGGSFANYVAVTQFVDSENWMKDTRLAPPSANPITVDTGGDLDNIRLSQNVSRETVLEINTNRVYGNSVLADLSSVDTIGDALDTSASKSHTAQSNIANELISRYRSGDRFTASDYEGYLKSQLDETLSDADIASMFEPNISDLSEHDKYGNMFVAEAGVGDFGDVQWSIYNMGALGYDGGYTGENLGESVTMRGVDPSSTSDWLGANPIGLSPLAMYNFLNTNFGVTSMTVYSPETSASSWSSNDYASVSSANVGFFGFMYTVESFVLVLGSAILGLFYAVGLVQIVVASLPRILSGVFGTAVGSLAMVTKLLVSTVVLILEVIGTMVLYMVFDSLLLSILRGSETLIDTVSGMTGFAVVNAAGGILKSAVVILLGITIVIFSIKNRTKLAKMIEEVTTDFITKLMSGLDNSMNQGSMMHDGQAVARAGQAGTIHGDDGQLGSRGSGAYDSAVAGGHDPESALGVKDAIRETLGQEALSAEAHQDDPDYEGKSKRELAKDMAGRYKDYKKAEAKDAIAAGLGGLATGLTLAGVSDLDGGARDRIEDLERAERRKISDRYRGIGSSAEEAIRRNLSQSQVDAMENSDSDTPLGDLYEESLQGVDAESQSETLEDQDQINPELTKMEEDDGIVLPNQEEYGTVAEFEGLSNTSAADDSDVNADNKLKEVIGEDYADVVDLDDKDSHPPLDTLSEEHDDYIDGLGEASAMQLEAADNHTQKAVDLNKEADELEQKIADLEAIENPTSEQEAEAEGLRRDVEGLRSEAETQKAQARKAKRKSQKISAKQQSAIAMKNKDAKKHAAHQSEPIKKAQALGEATKTHNALAKETEQLQAEIQEMYDSGQTEGLGEKQAQYETKRAETNKARQKMQALTADVKESIPQPAFEPLHEHTPEQKQAYMAEQGLSEAQYEEEVQATPTSANQQAAQAKALKTVAEMSTIRGKTPEQTMVAQNEHVAKKAEKLYGPTNPTDKELPQRMAQVVSKRNQTGEKVAQAQAEVNRLKQSNVALDPKVVQAAEAKLQQASSEYLQAEQEADALQPDLDKYNERKAYMQTMSSVQADNNQRLQQQSSSMAKTKDQARRAGAVANSIKQFDSKSGQTLVPKNAQIISGKRAENDLKVKEASMKSMGITSPQKYQRKMDVLNAPIHKVDEELKQQQRRYNSLKNSTDAVKKNSVARRIGDLTKEKDSLIKSTQQERARLQKNAAGLYRNGYTPQKTVITGGKSIQGDIGTVTHTAELLGLKMRELQKLPDPKTLAPEDQKRYRALTNKINVYRKQLLSANISPKMLDTPQSTVSLAKDLQKEYHRAVGPTFEDNDSTFDV